MTWGWSASKNIEKLTAAPGGNERLQLSFANATASDYVAAGRQGDVAIRTGHVEPPSQQETDKRIQREIDPRSSDLVPPQGENRRRGLEPVGCAAECPETRRAPSVKTFPVTGCGDPDLVATILKSKRGEERFGDSESLGEIGESFEVNGCVGCWQ